MAKKSKKPAQRGSVNNIILEALSTGDKYGYEIINEIVEKTDGKIVLKQPSLYSSLTRFEQKGYVSSYWRDSAIGGRRHYYSITQAGREFFKQSKRPTFNFDTKTEENTTLKNDRQTTGISDDKFKDEDETNSSNRNQINKNAEQPNTTKSLNQVEVEDENNLDFDLDDDFSSTEEYNIDESGNDDNFLELSDKQIKNASAPSLDAKINNIISSLQEKTEEKKVVTEKVVTDPSRSTTAPLSEGKSDKTAEQTSDEKDVVLIDEENKIKEAVDPDERNQDSSTTPPSPTTTKESSHTQVINDEEKDTDATPTPSSPLHLSENPNEDVKEKDIEENDKTTETDKKEKTDEEKKIDNLMERFLPVKTIKSNQQDDEENDETDAETAEQEVNEREYQNNPLKITSMDFTGLFAEVRQNRRDAESVQEEQEKQELENKDDDKINEEKIENEDVSIDNEKDGENEIEELIEDVIDDAVAEKINEQEDDSETANDEEQDDAVAASQNNNDLNDNVEVENEEVATLINETQNDEKVVAKSDEVADNNQTNKPATATRESFTNFDANTTAHAQSYVDKVFDNLNTKDDLYERIEKIHSNVSKVTNLNYENNETLKHLQNQKKLDSMKKLFGPYEKNIKEEDTTVIDEDASSQNLESAVVTAEKPTINATPITADESTPTIKENQFFNSSQTKPSSPIQSVNAREKETEAEQNESKKYILDENGILKIDNGPLQKRNTQVIDNVRYRTEKTGYNFIKDKPTRNDASTLQNNIVSSTTSKEIATKTYDISFEEMAKRAETFNEKFDNLTKEQIAKRKLNIDYENILGDLYSEETIKSHETHINDFEKSENNQIADDSSDEQDYHFDEELQENSEDYDYNNSKQKNIANNNVRFNSNNAINAKEDYNFYLVNKAKFQFGFVMFIIMLLQITATMLVLKQFNLLNSNHFIIYQLAYALSFIIWLIYILPFVFNKNKRRTTDYKLSLELMFGVLGFGIVLILTYAMNTFIGMELTNYQTYLSTLILPALLATNLVFGPLIFKLVLTNKKLYI